MVHAEGEIASEKLPEGDGWTQDEDVRILVPVLPRPFSIIGWPDVDSEDFKRYFPINLGNTGYDIIFFCVSYDLLQLGIHWSSPKTSLSTVSFVTSGTQDV